MSAQYFATHQLSILGKNKGRLLLPLLMAFAFATLCVCFALFAVSVFVSTAKNAKKAQRKTQRNAGKI
jgi:hypothetical protein